MATSRIADSVGRVLGDRYRLTRPLGVGASAHVYVAEDVHLRRQVAIKVLHPALAGDEAFLRRFRAEAQVVASLRHPNILTVFDWGEDGGSPYLVMELLEGGSLRALLDRGYLLSPAQAAAVGADAARALDYAHRRGLVHRDIKPANLIFDDEGRVRVADFGVARALAEATWTEPLGAVVGTARYAAPEQARGQQLDGRADVYALAVVLVEATTGVVPFASDTTIGTLMARVERPLAVPEQLGQLEPILRAAGTVERSARTDAATLVRSLDRAAVQMGPTAALPLAHLAERQVIERDDLDPTEFPGRPRLFDVAEVERNPDPPDPPEPVLHPRRRRRRRRVAVWVIAALIAMAAGGAGAAYATGQFLPYHPVPDLRGDTIASASAHLRPLHLHVVVSGRRYQSNTVAGTVLTQNPTFGKRLREGRSVSVVVSLGPQPVAVPKVDDQAANVAEGELQVIGLRWTTKPESSLTVAEGDVISTTPAPGTLLVPGKSVTLEVSSGKPFVAVPPVAVSSYGAEQIALQTSGLVSTETQAYSNTVPDGQVIGVDPGTGTVVRVGTTVTVEVSEGPHLVQIPDLAGDSVTVAAQALSNDGFVPQFAGDPLNNVTGTAPSAGTMAIFGSSVQIVTG